MASKRTPRNRVIIWTRNVLVGVVALTFVVLFGLPTGGGSQRAVAEVDGVIVERDAFEFFRRTNENRQRQAVPENFDPQRFRELVDNLTRDQLIQRYVLAAEAEALGLHVSRAEILDEIRSDPGFQVAGRFDPDVYETFIARSDFDTESSYLDQLRHDLLIRKLGRLLQSPIRVSERTALDRQLRDRTTVKLRYAAARIDAFAGKGAVDDTLVDALLLSSPERLQSAYESRYDEFNQPESVRASHILFRGEDAQQRAEVALARLRDGEDFAALAGELSEDAATSGRGGDLGSFPRGRMLPQLETAAFAAEPGSVAGPVASERGLHLIRVVDKQAGLSRPLAEVERQLARELLANDGASQAARQAANGMAERLRAGVGFEVAARESGLAVDETTAFRPDAALVPGIGRVPGLRQAAFRLSLEDPVSTRVFAAADAFYLVKLIERDQPDPAALRDELRESLDGLQQRARNATFERYYRKLRTDLQNEGKLVLYDLYPDR